MTDIETIKGLIEIDIEDLGLSEVLDILTVDREDLRVLEKSVAGVIFDGDDSEKLMDKFIDRALNLEWYQERC